MTAAAMFPPRDRLQALARDVGLTLGGFALLAIAIASVFALCAWMIPNG